MTKGGSPPILKPWTRAKGKSALQFLNGFFSRKQGSRGLEFPNGSVRHVKAGRPAQAEAILQEVLRRDSGNLEAALTLGALWIPSGRRNEAARLYREVLAKAKTWRRSPLADILERDLEELSRNAPAR